MRSEDPVIEARGLAKRYVRDRGPAVDSMGLHHLIGEIFGMPNAPNARNRGADGVEEVLPEKGARTHTPQEIAGMVLPGSGFHYAGHEVRSKTMRNIVCCCWWWCLFCLQTC